MTQDKQEKWLVDRLAYLRGLKAPIEQQRRLLVLADKPDRTADDDRKLAALIRAEKAVLRGQKARADAARILNAGKPAERKARDHALYRSAGLMILAGLVDTQTGLPALDRGVLLGGMLFIAQVAQVARTHGADADGLRDAPRLRTIWKSEGDALLASKTAQNGKSGEGATYPLTATQKPLQSPFDAPQADHGAVGAQAPVAQQRIDLVTRFEDKEAVRAAGSTWDADRRVWFVKPGQPLEPVVRWLPAAQEE